MIVNDEQLDRLNEAVNAGFSEMEALEYAGLPQYFKVEVGGNDAGRDDFPAEFYEFHWAYTTVEEAISEAKSLSTARVLDLAGFIKYET